MFFLGGGEKTSPPSHNHEKFLHCFQKISKDCDDRTDGPVKSFTTLKVGHTTIVAIVVGPMSLHLFRGESCPSYLFIFRPLIYRGAISPELVTGGSGAASKKLTGFRNPNPHHDVGVDSFSNKIQVVMIWHIPQRMHHFLGNP